MTFKQISKEMKDMFGIDIKQKSRKEHIIKAKYISIHCMVFYSSEITSVCKVSEFMEVKQHGTILNALQEYNHLYSTDKVFKQNSDAFINHVLSKKGYVDYVAEIAYNKKREVLSKRIKMMKKQLKILENR